MTPSRGRTVLVVAQPPDGGVHRHITSAVPGLAARGYDVVLAGIESYAGVPGTRHVQLDMPRGIDPRGDAVAARNLARIIREVRPALVHAHSSKAGALVRALRPVLLRGVPVVYTPHGYAFAGYFESEKQRAAYRAIERGLAPLTSVTLCVCEHERELAAEIGPVSSTRVVHNGVEPYAPVAADPRIAALAERGPVVGMLSLLRPGKGVDTLVDAAVEVVRDRPDVTFVVAGDGALQGEIEARIAAGGLDGRFVLLGRIEGAGPLLAGVSLSVNASHAESFPYAVLESMVAGVPMVATDVGGVGEALTDGVTGLLVPPKDPAALAAGIGRLLDDPALAARLAAAAQAEATAKFGLDVMADGIASVYGELGV